MQDVKLSFQCGEFYFSFLSNFLALTTEQEHQDFSYRLTGIVGVKKVYPFKFKTLRQYSVSKTEDVSWDSVISQIQDTVDLEWGQGAREYMMMLNVLMNS